MDEKKRILIAEDEKPLAEAFSAKLSNEGFEVHVAQNGTEAISLFEKEKFDLGVLDLVMPEVDGFGVLEALKEKGISLPIIVVSNLAQEVDKAKAIELGAISYFVKSNTPLSELVEQIQEALK